jgi:hypothetical protein
MVTGQVQHAEPLNWWVGMKDNNLQLMINGEGVGETDPVIHYKGVSIIKVNRAESRNYLFIDLVIAPTTKPGTVKINFNKAGKTIFYYDYSLLARTSNASK